jgi:hypothetical protein
MAKVLVGRSSSHCSECRGNADPDDTHHIRGGPSPSGFSEGSALSDNNGCGAEFTERVNLYAGDWA